VAGRTISTLQQGPERLQVRSCFVRKGNLPVGGPLADCREGPPSWPAKLSRWSVALCYSPVDGRNQHVGPPMPRPSSQTEALTIGQLARRWGVSAARVRSLVSSGQLPGAFTIPSAGRYGATVKVPLATVIQLETQDWSVVPENQGARPKPPRRKDDSGPAFRHFPKLRASLEQPASGSDEAAQG
jgi:hypothetical protein